ncbi:unnamed protein product, partial [Podospora anserina S mat+]
MKWKAIIAAYGM